MSHGKNVCKVLKEIRQKVADDNEIPLEIRECTFEGDCKGTCPYCEAEVRYLERELQKRQALGKAVTVAGIALSSVIMSGCHPLQGEPLPPEEPPTDTITQVADLETSENQNDTLPPQPNNYTELETTLGFVFGGIEVEDNTSNVDSALLREEIPIIDEIPDDSGLDTIIEP